MQFTYTNGEKQLVLEPLKGQIDPDASNFTVGKVKVEVRLIKRAQGRWGDLVGDAPDSKHSSLSCFTVGNLTSVFQVLSAPVISSPPSNKPSVQKKTNWDEITTKILDSDKEKSTEEDPNVGGDSTLNGFFQKIFADSDEDTKRAMMKSYQESGGTHLSTNWGEVSKGKVPVSPPQGSEWKNWG